MATLHDVMRSLHMLDDYSDGQGKIDRLYVMVGNTPVEIDGVKFDKTLNCYLLITK